MQYNDLVKNNISKMFETIPFYHYPVKQLWIINNGENPSFISSRDYFYGDGLLDELSKIYNIKELSCVEDLYFSKNNQHKVLKSNIVVRVTENIIIEFYDTVYKNSIGEKLFLYLDNSDDEEEDDIVTQYMGLKRSEPKENVESFMFSDFKKHCMFRLWYDCKTDKSEIEKIIEISKTHRVLNGSRKGKSKINLVVSTRMGYSLNSFELKKPEIDLELNYGSSLLSVHETIVSRLNEKNGKGIVLLHGAPGTGKTNYIKLLLSLVNKTVIYVPPMMAEFISSESFIPFLMDYPNSILVIEDGENIVKQRTSGGSQAVSNILNLSDGILGECLKMQVIVTFNADRSEIDKALLRKGRLIAEHKFDKLSKEVAQKLSDKLGFNTTIKEPMCLTDIYNQNEEDNRVESGRRKVGF